jgi:hypothetical protein
MRLIQPQGRKEMKYTKMMTMVLSLLAMAGLSGCAMFNKATVTHTRTTTIGQELIDLQEAREKDMLSENEYDKLRKEIIKGGPSIHAACGSKCSSD